MGQLLKSFREIHASELEPRSMQEAMDAQGYLLIRGVLPAEDVAVLLGEILEVVSAAGWLLPGYRSLERVADVSKACGDTDEEFKSVYKRIFNMESLHAFAHHPRLREVLSLLVGPRLLIQPKLVARLIFPNCERLLIDAHQDHQSMAGDPESFTAWFPLHDCPVELGPLRVMEGSHRFGLQKSDPKTGFVVRETALGGDWVGGAIHAGDVLIFHSLTVHAATPNVSDRVRISLDCRFQDYRRAINPAALVFPGSEAGGRSWIKTYAGWHSGELQYFWKRLPLRFEPSRLELAELAETAEPPEMRARYARILSQLDSQMPR